MDWIDIKEKLPDYDGDYLCHVEQLQECGAIIKKQRVVTNSFNTFHTLDKETITHWMKLPEAPKSGG